MPAKSAAQQKAAGAALAAKRDPKKKKTLKGASRSMVTSMDERELEELASTPQKGKPQHVADKRGAGKKATKRHLARSARRLHMTMPQRLRH